MSVLARVGAAVTVLGGLWDLGFHVGALPAGLDGALAHVLTLVGMLLVLAGLIERGLSLPRPHLRSLKEERSHALR